MIYIEQTGRMGNQMFSYVFSRKLQMGGQNIGVDFKNYEYIDKTWGNSLINL